MSANFKGAFIFKTFNNFQTIFSDDYFQISLFQWQERNDFCQIAPGSVVKPVISMLSAFMATKEQWCQLSASFKGAFIFKTFNNFQTIFSDDYFQISLFQWQERNHFCQMARGSVLKPVISMLSAFMATREQWCQLSANFKDAFKDVSGAKKFVYFSTLHKQFAEWFAQQPEYRSLSEPFQGCPEFGKRASSRRENILSVNGFLRRQRRENNTQYHETVLKFWILSRTWNTERSFIMTIKPLNSRYSKHNW